MRKTLTPRFTDFFTDFEKKRPIVLQSIRKENDDVKSKLKGMESELESLKASMKLTIHNKEEQGHV